VPASAERPAGILVEGAIVIDLEPRLGPAGEG
jgi:hypothetical protein